MCIRDRSSSCECVIKSNFINQDKTMISYKDLYSSDLELCFYPSSLGVNCEINFADNNQRFIYFNLKLSDEQVEIRKEPGEYWIMCKNIINELGENNEKILGIIQTPLVKDKSGNIYYNNKLEISQLGSGYYQIRVIFLSLIHI